MYFVVMGKLFIYLYFMYLYLTRSSNLTILTGLAVPHGYYISSNNTFPVLALRQLNHVATFSVFLVQKSLSMTK